MINQLPDEWFHLLHTLWTKATNSPDYVKAEWMQLESILHRSAEAIARQEANKSSKP